MNEWQPGVCEKPRISCRDCRHRKLLPPTDAAIYGHLAGEHTLGLYRLLARSRPSCAATHVGGATAGLSGDGVFADF